jgi:hypothetical protein
MSGDTRPATIDDLYAAMVEANDIVAGQRRRIAELETALAVALTALCSWQSYMEATSDGMSRPSRETASRLYDHCSDAIAACDSAGIKPNLSSGPEE